MKHVLIPDVQAKKGTPTDHLKAAGKLIVDEQPDVVVCIGDFADMPSLSIYDKPGSKSHEGKRYYADLESAKESMRELLRPIRQYNRQQRKNKKKTYTPRMVMTYGNHENRINRAVDSNPAHLEGVISLGDLEYEKAGWETYPFLEVVCIDGIYYSHYFVNPRSLTSYPVAGTADAKLNNLKCSFIMGHQQHEQIADAYDASGRRMRGLVMGAFYQHDEDYMGPQKNTQHYRGMAILHDVKDGTYDLEEVSIDRLLRKYG
jgi:hypothetical protein